MNTFSRRQFIKGAIGAGVAALALPDMAACAPKARYDAKG
ncbi:MAG: twin-arginine translocation signal domain-containing protein, partial [Tannerella sp.]|nr:twin-arginine translocation signal domain-containing protein [Tannerella sp.]MDR1723632.1 twin-arginine translocation signal domain-containing protein [Tannerella sp.]